MILKITNSDEEYGINVYKISLFNFGQIEYHPFISSQEWDYVEIDLCEDTPRGYIRQLINTTKVVPMFDRNNITVKVMQLLCEIVPDYTAKLRTLYLKDKEAFIELLLEISKQYEW